MHLTPLLTLLSTTTLALSAALPKHVTYCSNPSTCSSLPVQAGQCETFAPGGFPTLIFDAGLKCSVYAEGSCMKRFGVRAGKVSKVQGVFDTYTDPRAMRNHVPTVGSFVCN